jgi:lipoprotein NlpD
VGKISLYLTLALCALLTACTSTTAPVVDGWKQNNRTAEISNYRVQPSDTLYSIAWAFGVDYRDLARYNNLREPYAVKPGQILRMSKVTAAPAPAKPAETQPAAIVTAAPASPPPTATTQSAAKPQNTAQTKSTQQATEDKTAVTKTSENKTAATKTAETTTAVAAVPTATRGGWKWPTQGRVVRGFSKASGGNRGIDIAGRIGQPVVAANAGKVVYAGSSLPGYGNLIILKHNDNELSAYAFNKVMMVKEGQTVTAGETIAQMGQNDKSKAILHFEIRQSGKPVNPMTYFKSH